MANLQIFKLNNYIHILDKDTNALFVEHSFRVLVRKLTSTGTKYDIIFLRPGVVSPFYSATIGSIFDSSNTAYSQANWELFYQQNTGDVAPSIQRTTTVLRPATSGVITAGKISVSIANVHATVAGTVNGVTLKPTETLNFDAGGVSNTLNAISYNSTNSEFLIITIE